MNMALRQHRGRDIKESEMPKNKAEENRIYEADAHSLPSLKLQIRSTKKEGQVRDGSLSHPDDAQLTSTGFTFSRDVILRLISRMKDE